MEKSKILALFAALDDIMQSNGPYTEKVKAIKDEASEQDMINIEEFIAWFDEVDDEDENDEDEKEDEEEKDV